MIPSAKWFPRSLQERAAWFQNFTTHFEAVYVSLGFTLADLTALQADNAMMQFLATTATAVEAFKDAARQFRIIVTEGSVGDVTPVAPTYLGPTEPDLVPPGIFERLIAMVERIRTAAAYTAEIGASLQIIPSSSSGGGSNVILDELKPVVKTSPSFGEYKFTVNVTRLGMEAFKVQIQRNGDGWQDAAFATSNPLDITIVPTTPGQPERILVRAILLQKNEPVGEPSDPTYVTVNP